MYTNVAFGTDESVLFIEVHCQFTCFLSKRKTMYVNIYTVA